MSTVIDSFRILPLQMTEAMKDAVKPWTFMPNSMYQDLLAAAPPAPAAECCPLENSDAARFVWALPILSGLNEAEGERRALAIAAAMLLGLDGRDLIDHAMRITRSKG